jgi:DNA-binding response OmpR family regulator
MVDDDSDDRRIYGTVLCYNGFNIVLVPDCSNAKRVLSLIRPDLILLDLSLPDGDGLSLCSDVTVTLNIPVIVLSGMSRKVMEAGAMASGCLRYIEKPTSPVLVLHEIEEILGRPPLPGDLPAPWRIAFPFTESA